MKHYKKGWAITTATGEVLYCEIKRQKALDFVRLENKLLHQKTWKVVKCEIIFEV